MGFCHRDRNNKNDSEVPNTKNKLFVFFMHTYLNFKIDFMIIYKH